MVKEEEKKQEEQEIGLVSLTGEVGTGMKMPNGDVIQLNNIDVGHAQLLAYLITEVSEIKKNLC